MLHNPNHALTPLRRCICKGSLMWSYTQTQVGQISSAWSKIFQLCSENSKCARQTCQHRLSTLCIDTHKHIDIYTYKEKTLKLQLVEFLQEVYAGFKITNLTSWLTLAKYSVTDLIIKTMISNLKKSPLIVRRNPIPRHYSRIIYGLKGLNISLSLWQIWLFVHLKPKRKTQIPASDV